jgi:8-oxo-dGTP pyrophosphatase MutT (NUDIX family)
VSPAEPVEPLPSSTVILLRDATGVDGPFQVLMLERHGSVTFPGAHAFPGGVVDPGDHEVPASLPAGQAWAPDGEGDQPADALPYWVAGVREVFEEVGILLAADEAGPLEGELPAEVRALRGRLHAGEPFGALLGARGLRLATEGLCYFARWITPQRNPRRFDTRFLVGRVPLGQEACADGTETVHCEWHTPAAALAAFERGAIRLIPPTVHTLDDLAAFPSVDAVLADARRRVVRALRPDLPGAGGVARPLRPLVLRDGRWRPA